MALADFLNGAGKSIQQLLLERQLESMGVSPAQILQRNQNRQDAELQMKRDEFNQNQQRLAQNEQDAAQQKTYAEANTLGDQLPPGQFLQESDPAVATMQRGGRGGLLTKQESRPAVLEGPLLPGDTGEAKQGGFLKTASQKQIDTNTDNAREQSKVDAQNAATAESAAARTASQQSLDAYRQYLESRPPAAGRETFDEWKQKYDYETAHPKPNQVPTVVVQGVDDQGNPTTKIVPKVAGTEFRKGPGAVTENRLTSAKAVLQTGNDIIKQLSDPNVAAKLGPVMGRYNNMADFVGNPPPEFAHLAGQIESYSLANMGVHGMRANNGAEAIKQTVGLGRHTPQSMIAALQGLNGFANHLMENEGRSVGGSSAASGASGGTVPMIAPDGRRLNVPAEKVQELEALGAKRQ